MINPRIIIYQPVAYDELEPLDNWLELLNNVQPCFRFFRGLDNVDVDRKSLKRSGGYDLQATFRSTYNRYPHREYVIFVTNLQYEDGAAGWFDDHWSVVSFAPIIRKAIGPAGAKGYLADADANSILCMLDIALPDHDFVGGRPDTRGCPSDYCDDINDLKRRKGEWCSDCRLVIEQCQRAGRLTSPQYASLLCMLDATMNRRTCLTFMPFNRQRDRWYESTLRPLIQSAGYCPLRADKNVRPYVIREDIVRDLYRASVVVADISGKNPNVMYELGMAHALHKRVVILLGHRETADSDYRDYRCVTYSPADSRWTKSFAQMLRED